MLVEMRIIVKQMFILVSHDVTDEIGMPEWSEIGDLYIAHNFLETTATLLSRTDSDSKGILLARIFPSGLASKTPALTNVILETDLSALMNGSSGTGAMVAKRDDEECQGAG